MKKTISMALALVIMVLMMSAPAYATDITTDGGQAYTTVTYEVINNSFLISVPATISLDTDGTDLTITGKNVQLKANSVLNVTIDSDFTLEHTVDSTKTIAYQVTKKDDTIPLTTGANVAQFTTSEEDQTSVLTFKVTGTPPVAGDYSDVVTFTVNVESVDSES